MKLGISTHGRFSASDLPATVVGSSVAFGWWRSGALGHHHCHGRSAGDKYCIVHHTRICCREYAFLPVLKHEGLYIAVLSFLYYNKSLLQQICGVVPVGGKNLGSYISSRVLCPCPGTLVEANKDKETIPQSRPIQVTSKSQDSVQRER